MLWLATSPPSNDLFFVRNHNPVPDIDPEEWELEVEATPQCGIEARSFTLEDLKTKFPKHEVRGARRHASLLAGRRVTTCS